MAAAKDNATSSMVELEVSAKNLLNKDATSKSDPILVLYLRDTLSKEFVEVGRTEAIKDNLNPKWEKKFCLEYKFETRQELRFVIYDYDGSPNLGDHDYLGSIVCTLGEIVAAPYSKYEGQLETGKKAAKAKKPSIIQIYSEEMGTNKETYQMTLSGKKLDKKDLMGKSDPFLIISKLSDEGEWVQAIKTEVIKKTLDPEWRPITGYTAGLTGRNPNRKLRFQVYDFDSIGKSDLIGEFETTFLDMRRATKDGQSSWPLINPKKKEKKKNYEHSGLLVVNSLKVDDANYTFIEYVQNGLMIHFTVAVDFTASNGSPKDPNSLHARAPNQDNQYITAIKAVGSIIQDYDTDKMFPGLGFGAKVPPDTEVSHLFCLNFKPKDPFCAGVNGLLEAYDNALTRVKLYGPTNFAPVINHVAHFATTYENGIHYFVLLIITDGMICDIDETTEAIVKASRLPLSIIIVGVGNEDFSAMEFLDGDKYKLSYKGVLAERDIVQFVALRDFISKDTDSEKSKAQLAQAVLQEVPKQVMEYMRTKKVTHL